VFQKRVAVVQSIVVLLCFGLVLFTHGAAGGYIDLPRVQNMVSRSYSLRSSSPVFGLRSLPGSPGSTRPTSSYHTTGHRRQISDESQGGSFSPAVAYAPPTPTSDNDSGLSEDVRGPSPPVSADPRSVSDVVLPLLRSNSSPPDFNGENEGDDEGKSDSLESDSECSGSRR
jgi:hypothetical protein